MSLFGQSTSGSSLFGTPANQQKPLNPFATQPATQPAQQSGLFTTPSTASGGGLFGSSTTSTAPQSGGLSGSTPTGGGGLFGSSTTSQPQQSGGLFGSTPASQPQQGGGLFGSTPAAQPQQGGGGLLGSTATPQPQQQTGGGLFGSTATSQPQQSGGGLFGSTSTSTSQPQQNGGGLFGSSTTTSQPSGGGLFGSTPASQPQTSGLFSTPATTAQQGGGLFGATTNQGGGGLFGSTANKPQDQQQQQQSNPFGGPNANNQQQKPSLFSNPTQPQQSSLFGGASRLGSLGGSTNQQQQQTVPGVKIDISQVRGTTRFNDLHEDLQKQIEQIDAFIQQQISYKEQCDAIMPAHGQSVASILPDVEFVQNQLETCELSIENDSAAVEQVKSIVDDDAENARISFRAVENLKLPQQFHQSGVWNSISGAKHGVDIENASAAIAPTDLLSFFNASATTSTTTLERYQSNLAEIETHLGVVEANMAIQSQQMMFRQGREGGSRSRDDQIAELSNVLREFENGILQVAEAVGRTRESAIDVVEAGQGGINNGWR